MKRTINWRGEALNEEVKRLHGEKLEYQAIAQVMGIALRTVQETCHELGLIKPNARPKTQAHIDNMIALVTKVKPIGELERRDGELPLDYATRVLRALGELPMISKTPLEKITLANRLLKARGLPQIADRHGWVV